MLFSERMKRRLVLWRGVGEPQRFYKHSFHRLKERYTFRDKNDPESKWHCCEFWQRTLHSKWNAREFAQKHGCVVPNLYWFGRTVSRLPFKSLPNYYVIKPNFSFSRRGVYVMADEIELFRQSTYNKAQLRAELRRITGGLLGQPILVEEFITDDGEYKLPTEYRCHVFGETIAAIAVIHRAANKQHTTSRYYTEHWETFDDPMNTKYQLANYIDPPECLDTMLMMARELGEAYDTYVRIDFYVSRLGCVFGEFTPYHKISPWLDVYFGALWQKIFPDRM
jgi:hypothetical protein